MDNSSPLLTLGEKRHSIIASSKEKDEINAIGFYNTSINLYILKNMNGLCMRIVRFMFKEYKNNAHSLNCP